MRLAVFDLDQTLLSSDSDYLWGRCLADAGLAGVKSSGAAAQAGEQVEVAYFSNAHSPRS